MNLYKGKISYLSGENSLRGRGYFKDDWIVYPLKHREAFNAVLWDNTCPLNDDFIDSLGCPVLR
jgi:hypothetical protein